MLKCWPAVVALVGLPCWALGYIMLWPSVRLLFILHFDVLTGTPPSLRRSDKCRMRDDAATVHCFRERRVSGPISTQLHMP